MAGELLLVNPRRKKAARRNPRKRRASSARRNPVRRARARTARRNPIRRRRVARRNPIFRRRRAARRNPRRFRARRNPINIGGITNALTPALIGGIGAVALDVAYGALPIPVTLKTGTFAPVVKGGVILGAGMIARNFLSSKTVDIAVATSLAIIAYNFIRAKVLQLAPTLPMGAYVSDDLSYAGAGVFLPGPTGADDASMAAYTGYSTPSLAGVGAGVGWQMPDYGDAVS